MASIFSPSRWLGYLSRTSKQNLSKRGGRRHRTHEHLHNAVAETLESRLMFTAAPHLVFSVQPADTNAGSKIPTITVTLKDASNNTVTTSPAIITLAVNSGPGGVRNLVSAVTSNGVASFSAVNLTVAGTYSLKATVTTSFSSITFSPATSNSFAINPGNASKLIITQQPTSGVLNGTVSTINVAVEDTYGNICTSNTSNVTFAINTGGGTLTGTTTVAAVAGVASFSTLSISNTGAHTLKATDSSLTPATTSSFSNNAFGQAAQLVITQQATTTTAGGTISTVKVSIEDAAGNVVTNNTSSVTLALTSSSGTLRGATTVAAVNGVATFSNLNIREAGLWVLHATDGTLTAANSNNVSITAGAANKLAFTTQPADTTAGATMNSVAVSIEDQYGNVVATDTSSVTISISSTGSGFAGTLTVAAVAGVATFSDLSATKAAGYTLHAIDSSLTAANSSTFNITGAAADHLAFQQAPADGAVGSLGTVTVAVQDQYGNIATSDTSNVMIALTSTGSTLLGTSTVAAVNGVATFSNLAIHTPGSYTLSAVDGELTGDTTGSFGLTVGAPDHISFALQPDSALAGQTMGLIVVELDDQFGNKLTGDVTLTLNGEQNATLHGTVTQSITDGYAVFNDLYITTAGDYTFTATVGDVTGDSDTFTINPGFPDHLAFTQLTGGKAGNMGSVQVSVEDQYNNICTTDNVDSVTISQTSGSGTITGTMTALVSHGVATFSDLAVTTPDEYAFHADCASSLSGSSVDLTVDSDPFTITAGNPDHLHLTAEPGDTIYAGADLGTVTVEVEDAYGNIVTSYESDVTVGIADGSDFGSGDLHGTVTVTAVNGVATFTGLNITKAGSGALTCSIDGDVTSATTDGFDIVAGTASQIGFTVAPSDTAAGATMSEVHAALEDPFGNVCTDFTGDISLYLVDSSNTLNGTLTVTAVNGVAAFTDLSMTQAGGYTLGATIYNGDVADGSADFSINAASPDHISFIETPNNGAVGTVGETQVAVEDQYGNICTNAEGLISLTLSGEATLLGTTSAHVQNGVATFGDLAIHTPGSYSFTASSNAFDSTGSDSFTLNAGDPAKLQFSGQPSTTAAGHTISTVSVQVTDTYGNALTVDNYIITLSLNGSGALNGTLTAQTVGGVAQFTDLSINTAGSYTLTAAGSAPVSAPVGVQVGTSPGIQNVTSNSFTINADTASKVVVTTSPTSGTAGAPLTLVAKVEDQYGNVVDTNDNVTVGIQSGPNGATLNGTKIVAAVHGVATFTGLTLSTVGTYTLKATDADLTLGTSSSFTTSVGAPARLLFLQQPSNVKTGKLMTPAVTVQVVDAYGNLCPSAHVLVTLSTTKAITGVSQVYTTNGIATFSGFALLFTGTFSLTAKSGTLTLATSNSFIVS